MNIAFKSIYENTTLFESKSDFQIISSIRAYEIIILLKVSPDGSEVNFLKKFNTIFLQRIKVLNWIIQIITLIVFLYVLGRYFSNSQESKAFFDKYGNIFTVLGALGLTFLGNFIPFIKKKSLEIIMRLFGYPKEFIKHDRDKGRNEI